jgi:hypothetical protein
LSGSPGASNWVAVYFTRKGRE